MNTIEKIVAKIVEEYGKEAITFIHDKDKFLKLFIEEYAYIIENKIGSTSMIVNPEAFTFVDFKDIDKLRENIETQLYKKLYTNDYISESEYKNLCKEN